VLQNTILTEQIFEFFVSEDGLFLLAMPIADASLDRSNMEQGLLKIKIDRTAEMVCIENVILVADNDQLIAHKFTTSCAETGWTSSVDNILDAKDLELYPNPASDKLNIYIDSNSFIPESISFLTLNGETVFADNLVGKNYEVDVKEWAEGMYFVLVNGKDAQYTKKFIIQHDR